MFVCFWQKAGYVVVASLVEEPGRARVSLPNNCIITTALPFHRRRGAPQRFLKGGTYYPRIILCQKEEEEEGVVAAEVVVGGPRVGN